MTLRQLIEWYKAGYSYVARATEADQWHPCTTKREAEHDAGQHGDFMSIAELVALLITGGLPCMSTVDGEMIDGMSLDDALLALRLAKRVAKSCERIA